MFYVDWRSNICNWKAQFNTEPTLSKNIETS